jgi:hypothetical protein
MAIVQLTTPLTEETARSLKLGDTVESRRSICAAASSTTAAR